MHLVDLNAKFLRTANLKESSFGELHHMLSTYLLRLWVLLSISTLQANSTDGALFSFNPTVHLGCRTNLVKRTCCIPYRT